MASRIRQLAAIAVLNLSVVGACVSVTPPLSKPNVDVRVGLITATTLAPILVATDDGEFTARGLNVSIQTITDPSLAMLSVTQGQLEIGNISLAPAALNVFHTGGDLKIIAANAADPPGHGSSLPLIVRSQLIDSGDVHTTADLRGRKIAIGTIGARYSLAKALAPSKVSLSDVNVVMMTAPDAVAALSTGAIDAGIIVQPIASQAIAKGVGKIWTDDYDPQVQHAVLAVNTHFLEQHRDAVTAFLEVYVHGIRRFSDGKLRTDDQALTIVEKYTNTSPDAMRLAPDPYWPIDARIPVESLRAQEAFFLADGSLDYTQPADFEKLIDYGPLETALKNLGGT